MARTVLFAKPNFLATRRAEALSQASPTASSKRLEKGALQGNWSTFSIRKPQLGQRSRYNSITTVVRNSPHGKSRTSRSVVSDGSEMRALQPEQISRRFPRLRRTHSFEVLAFSSISCWKIVYPGQPSILVQSLRLNLPVYRAGLPRKATPACILSDSCAEPYCRACSISIDLIREAAGATSRRRQPVVVRSATMWFTEPRT